MQVVMPSQGKEPSTVSPGPAVGWAQPFLLPLTYDDSAGQKGIEGGGLLEEEVGEQHVEHGGEGAPHVVEGHADVLEAEVVGGDHADEDGGEGQDAAGHLGVEAQGGQAGAGGPAGRPQAEAQAQRGRQRALEEGDEERRVEAQRGAVQQVLVEEDHGDGGEPVEADHHGDAQGPQQEGRPPAPAALGRQQRVGAAAAQRHPQDPRPRQLRSAHGGPGRPPPPPLASPPLWPPAPLTRLRRRPRASRSAAAPPAALY